MAVFAVLAHLMLLMLLCDAGAALAHVPVLEPRLAADPSGNILARAVSIPDPTQRSTAVYGVLAHPGEVDAYRFTAQRTATVPLEALVPARPANADFYPTLALARRTSEASPAQQTEALPFPLTGARAETVISSPRGERMTFFEPFSLETLYHGNERDVRLRAGETYYVLVYEPDRATGDYVIGAGTIENFEGISVAGTIGAILAIKLGLFGNRSVPWFDILGLFIFMGGFVIGLGAVTVIDILGALGRKSTYWTETTIRAHKVTKPLIWIGFALAFIGGNIYYRVGGLTGTAALQLLIALPLVANGAFLTFYVSPKLLRREREGHASELLPHSLQTKIAVSFVISFVGWWAELLLLAYNVLALR